MEAIIELLPLSRPVTTEDQHGRAVAVVEEEFAHNETTLIISDYRGMGHPFYQIMLIYRPIGTLSARHLFAMKWLRMCDHVGLVQALAQERYRLFLTQCYTGILNGDGRATVEFVAAKEGGSRFEENLQQIQQQCLDHFTPHFDNVFREVVEFAQDYMRASPNTELAEFARRHLSGTQAGWATAR